MKEVSKEEYFKIFEQNEMVVFSSFSDIDGTLSFGYGVPAMDTEWGIKGSDEPVARCEMRKEHSRDDPWVYKYFIKKL